MGSVDLTLNREEHAVFEETGSDAQIRRFGKVDIYYCHKLPRKREITSRRDTVDLRRGFDHHEFRWNGGEPRKMISAPGKLQFLPAASTLSDRSLRFSVGFVLLSIDPSIRKELTSEYGVNPLVGYTQFSVPKATTISNTAMHLALTGDARDRFAAEAIAMMALAGLYRAACGPTRIRRSGLSETCLKRVFEFVEDNLEKSISLEDMAGLSGLSSFHFARSFKQESVMAPYQYVLARRLARAQELLAHSDKAAAEIAYTVGFSSQSHMISTFQRHLGVTPAIFRKNASDREPIR